ncbi:hypothetical protein KIH27_03330 [Mycobacterium sp. M1]|uniref:Uncharacterized protein n=1 Tax=Mycolicibacter acidiphilus TaxID=2835306 RepID=A0ABS5REA7_9MYCO|nr:hypothetical protein [Mycolicibacter acidiphilus]MBS9532615.1 hypothetical protein [Mycolicibacter acidiphilus]
MTTPEARACLWRLITGDKLTIRADANAATRAAVDVLVAAKRIRVTGNKVTLLPHPEAGAPEGEDTVCLASRLILVDLESRTPRDDAWWVPRARAYGISRAALRRAYIRLIADGLIRRDDAGLTHADCPLPPRKTPLTPEAVGLKRGTATASQRGTVAPDVTSQRGTVTPGRGSAMASDRGIVAPTVALDRGTAMASQRGTVASGHGTGRDPAVAPDATSGHAAGRGSVASQRGSAMDKTNVTSADAMASHRDPAQRGTVASVVASQPRGTVTPPRGTAPRDPVASHRDPVAPTADATLIGLLQHMSSAMDTLTMALVAPHVRHRTPAGASTLTDTMRRIAVALVVEGKPTNATRLAKGYLTKRQRDFQEPALAEATARGAFRSVGGQALGHGTRYALADPTPLGLTWDEVNRDAARVIARRELASAPAR